MYEYYEFVGERPQGSTNNNNNNNNTSNNNNKHAYAGATDSFTHLRVLLVLTDRGILAQSNYRVYQFVIGYRVYQSRVQTIGTDQFRLYDSIHLRTQ